MVEPPRVRIEDGDLAPLELGRHVLCAEHAVARELEPELEPLAARRRVEQLRFRSLAAAARIQSLRALAVDPQRRLAVRHPPEVDAPATPLVRHRRADVEPERRPEWAEALAERRGPVVERRGLVERDPVDRPGDEQRVWRLRQWIDELAEPSRGLCEAAALVFEVVDQCAENLR